MTTVYRLTPITEVAKAWIEENVSTEPWQWLGESLVIETRYVGDLVEGMFKVGLEIDTDFEVAA